ncbi:MAG: helix-turn-helix domain-containing protein, partial [Gammaproteobacteria bacterium]|nr:helix-turn-helix domain-containing protein [Gammaproteobacteria bacterium]MYG67983.1 helix-turn-helix domain-containing protein [Gammaproteobacteria bacterium]
VDEGPVLTSAGSAAGLDLCLHIVRSDHGASVANNVARRLVLAPHRDGGQRQFVNKPIAPGAGNGKLARLLDWLPAHINEDLAVGDLALHAGMSVRNFQRRFREATGTTPGAWLNRQRVDHARHLAETTELTVEQIAARSGFGAVETMRHHFRRLVGTTPTDYRRRFSRIRAGSVSG